MKATTIGKIFGGQKKLTGGVGAVLPLLYGLTQLNWEAAWPGIQKAMMGLGVASIAMLKGEAIQRGLVGLAERIASDPIINVGGVQEGSQTAWGLPQVNMPYIPLSLTMKGEKEVALSEEGGVSFAHSAGAKRAIEMLQHKISGLEANPVFPSPQDPCKELDRIGDQLHQTSMMRSNQRWGLHVEDWVPSAWLYHIQDLLERLERIRTSVGCKTSKQRSEENEEKHLKEHPEERLPF